MGWKEPYGNEKETPKAVETPLTKDKEEHSWRTLAFMDDPMYLASSSEINSFVWDTSEFTTAEIDISALFATPLTGTKRRKYAVYLDLTNPAGDAGAWTKCTVKVKIKVNGANYRTMDKKELAKADVGATAEPCVPIDIPMVAQDVQITMQFDVALDDDQTIYYHTVKHDLEP